MRLDAIAALEATINLRGSMTFLSPRAQWNRVTDERNRKCTSRSISENAICW